MSFAASDKARVHACCSRSNLAAHDSLSSACVNTIDAGTTVHLSSSNSSNNSNNNSGSDDMSVDGDDGDDDVPGAHAGAVSDVSSLSSCPATSASAAVSAALPPLSASPPVGAVDVAPYPHAPIFVLSKGRHTLERGTVALLVRELVPFTLVVEPAEHLAYASLLQRLLERFYGARDMHYADVAGTAASDAAASSRAVQHGVLPPYVPWLDDVLRPAAAHTCTSPCIADDDDDDDDVVAGVCGAVSGQRTDTCVACVRRRCAARLFRAYHYGYVFVPHMAAAVTAAADAVADAATAWETKSDAAPGSAAVASCMSSSDCSCAGGAVVDGVHADVLPPCDATHTTATTAPAAAVAAPSAAAATSMCADLPACASDEGSGVACVPWRLHSIAQLHALFRIAVLPENDKGVSYARNYILQVLAPQLMVRSGVDGDAHLDEHDLYTPGESKVLTMSALHRLPLGQAVWTAVEQRGVVSRAAAAVRPPHALYGLYWVFDDDIFGFGHADAATQRNVRVTARAMMRAVAARVARLQRNAAAADAAAACSDVSRSNNHNNMSNKAGSTAGGGVSVHTRAAVFTCREDALVNNFVRTTRVAVPVTATTRTATTTAPSSSGDHDGKDDARALDLLTYPHYALTACYSLEYSCFAYTYTDTALAINSYNNIACLFNYKLLHTPPRALYFPAGLRVGVRTPQEVLQGLPSATPAPTAAPRAQQTQHYNNNNNNNNNNSSTSSSVYKMWYRFDVREDYDFTLQLIARGMYTLRFRNLAFDVPQMSKLRGGMTDYYRHCQAAMRVENERFVRQWPAVAQHCVKGRAATERDDIRVHWGLLHPSRVRHCGAFLFLREPPPQLQMLQQRQRELAAARRQQQQQQRPQQQQPTDATNVTSATTTTTTSQALLLHTAHEQHTQPSCVHKRPRSASSSSTAVRAAHTATDNATCMHRDDASGTAANAVGVGGNSSNNSSRSNSTATVSSSSSSSSSLRRSEAARWRGYAVERWRALTTTEAARLGLRRLPASQLYVGAVVAIVPPLFSQRPSVVLATLIERTTRRVDAPSGVAGVDDEDDEDDDNSDGGDDKDKDNKSSNDNKGDGDVTDATDATPNVASSSSNSSSGHTTTTRTTTTRSATRTCVEWTAVAQGVRGMPLLSVTRCYAPPQEGVECVAERVDRFFDALCGVADMPASA